MKTGRLLAWKRTQGEGSTLLRGSLVRVSKGVATSEDLLVHTVKGSVQKDTFQPDETNNNVGDLITS